MTSDVAARSPVMADVAELAGVSHQTVSRVLNDHPNVRPATRERVLDAIGQLGYRRNLSARALVTRRTNTLGVVAFDTTLYGPASTLFSIEHAAREAGYFISIVSLKTITRSSVGEALSYLVEQSVDGIIAIAPQRTAAEAVAELPSGLPIVAVEGGEAGTTPVVAVDQSAGAAQATRHLLELGHTTVQHVAGPAEWLEAEGRLRGWRDTIEDAGAPVPEIIRGDWSPRSGYAAGRAVLARRHRPDAIFVANDQMTLGLMRALAEAGLRVPDDVSLVGFDDVPEAEFFSPPLTTVRQDFAEVGRASIRMLLDLVEHGSQRAPDEARHVVEPELIRRASTAPAS
ncbi:LacI family transcriptional regulator [Haloactinopolyspora alba]|uniref:LacI family transcriptional regulator n=1 Tax=Haloactinopolyspora alba TaxID=648780 RepID=A0A2P8E6Z7_9ACTN|nr:LacI family DNA-binding transcriptional regulator [Haloactinopolyspora alba]PSL05245.1 LacI family transcriptional regulator [Haloactinopolyspora alba]